MAAPPRRCALYARVSTRDQRPDLQLEQLRDHAPKRGWEIAAEFIDRGESGGKRSRPQLDALMQAALRREIDVVLVWKFDRFARSLQHLVSALAEFEALGIDFVSYTEELDTSTPMGRALFHVAGAMAELERSLNRERTRAGLEAARRRGKRLGRPRKALDLGKAERLRRQGLSWRAIGEKLGCSERTLRRALVAVASH